MTIYQANGKISGEMKNQINKYGYITVSSMFGENGKLIYERKFQYKYDRVNNWISRTEYKDDLLKEIVEREIEYYK